MFLTILSKYKIKIKDGDKKLIKFAPKTTIVDDEDSFLDDFFKWLSNFKNAGQDIQNIIYLDKFKEKIENYNFSNESIKSNFIIKKNKK